MALTFKRVHTLNEIQDIQSIQHAVWGVKDIDLVPIHFMVGMKHQAQHWAAFDHKKMIAIALIYPTLQEGMDMLHMLGTVPTHRGKDIGQKLLEKAIEHSKSIERKGLSWTYDCLDHRNAHFYHNIFKSIGF